MNTCIIKKQSKNLSKFEQSHVFFVVELLYYIFTFIKINLTESLPHKL